MGENNTFQGSVDRYKGITVDSTQETCEDVQLSEKLSASLAKWAEEKRRCIWFQVNIKDAAWVPVLAKNGFNFHHALGDFVMMYKWLPANEPSNLPPASHTNLGVGGMVFNEQDELLVVMEQHFEIPHWKLPGGYVEKGEDIKDAAVREVKEETGVDAVFESMITLRHTHNMGFGNSDIYIVVLLKATSSTITKSDMEIKDCKWMDIHTFLNHPHVHEFNRFLVQQAIDYRHRKVKLDLKKQTLTFGKFSREITSLVLDDV